MAEAQKWTEPGTGWWKSSKLLDRASDTRRYPLFATISCIAGIFVGSLVDRAIAAEIARHATSTSNNFLAHPHPMLQGLICLAFVALVGGSTKVPSNRVVVALLSLVTGAAFGELLYGGFNFMASTFNW